MLKKDSIKAYALKNAIEHSGKATSGPVINSLFNEGLKKNKIKETMPQIQKVLDEVNKLSLEEQVKEFKKLESIIGYRKEREGLPELSKLKKGKVVTRMSPSPSGPLTFGHIITLVPNFLYAKNYDGKFYIRIEDTNPENIYKPAYKMIEQESKWLCKNKVNIIIQSDRLEIYYEYAEKLIKSGDAYVCTCSQEKFKELITKSKACPCRKLEKKEQKERWSLMIEPGYREGEAVLRFKSDIKNKNPAMRDFPLARINESAHPRTGNKYRVWPLMNLAVTVDDIELGMTHIIRGKDHKDNSKRQEMIYKALKKSRIFPVVRFIGRLHLKEIKMSASQITKDVTSGKYKSFDDPKLPTLQSLKKQGYKPETFWKFIEDRGLSETDKTISMKDLKEVLDNIQKKSL
ncbi:MAG TPA: glutamate--tRNA ligase family protein [Candidatus Pacearchaeota archaeon]|jgi:glutamyl-tRNA synthetase|nr:glutamate--tRNA ligase family protein [Candidatus Pacearchaeota archaeon]